MGVIIDGGVNIGSGGILINTSSPLISFNFTFNQTFGDTAITIQSIGGFTSTPTFTPTVSPFIFNSTGTSYNPVTFDFTVSRPGFIATGQTFELYQNNILLQTKFVSYGFVEIQTVTYDPITVSINDSILILGYYDG
jgi:hypothetical protein